MFILIGRHKLASAVYKWLNSGDPGIITAAPFYSPQHAIFQSAIRWLLLVVVGLFVDYIIAGFMMQPDVSDNRGPRIVRHPNGVVEVQGFRLAMQNRQVPVEEEEMGEDGLNNSSDSSINSNSEYNETFFDDD